MRQLIEQHAEELERRNVYLQEELKIEGNFGEIIGSAELMQRVFRDIEMVAATDATVLVLGETGTGKELIARAIHTRSRRRDAVMVKVNCARDPGDAWPKANCSDTRRVHSPAPSSASPDALRSRTAAPFFSTRSASCRSRCR